MSSEDGLLSPPPADLAQRSGGRGRLRQSPTSVGLEPRGPGTADLVSCFHQNVFSVISACLWVPNRGRDPFLCIYLYPEEQISEHQEEGADFHGEGRGRSLRGRAC